jgi:hypothetical protein
MPCMALIFGLIAFSAFVRTIVSIAGTVSMTRAGSSSSTG